MERWKPVPGWEERYEVSDQGRVRSLMASQGCKAVPRKEPKVLRLSVAHKGYLHLRLKGAGRSARVRVNRLVLQAFRGPPPTPAHHGSHLNGVRSDNRLENLVWETAKENNARKNDHGTMLRGAKHHQAKVTAEQVRAIRSRYAAGGVTLRTLGVEYGIVQTAVGRIVRGETWKHV